MLGHTEKNLPAGRRKDFLGLLFFFLLLWPLVHNPCPLRYNTPHTPVLIILPILLYMAQGSSGGAAPLPSSSPPTDTQEPS